MNRGQSILVTGAGGGIGSALSRALAGSAHDRLVLLDRSEQNIQRLESDLAEHICVPIVMTGLRPGEKLDEELISDSEFAEATADPTLCRAVGRQPYPEQFDRDIDALARCVHERDILGLIETLCRIVPEYRPSDSVLGLLKQLQFEEP